MNLRLKNIIAVAIANGGIIPPTIAAVIGAAFPSVNAAVANTYAALLKWSTHIDVPSLPITKPIIQYLNLISYLIHLIISYLTMLLAG